MHTTRRPNLCSDVQLVRRNYRSHRAAINWRHAAFPLGLIAFLLLWDMIVRLGQYPAFVLPSPYRVALRLLTILHDPSFLGHILITLREVFGGLALGLTVAVLLGYALAKSPTPGSPVMSLPSTIASFEG